MKLTTRFLICTLFFTLLQGCKDNSVSIYDTDVILKCHSENRLDANMTKNKIIGEWEWMYIQCCGEANHYENATQEKGLKITFKEDGTGVEINEGVASSFKWNIRLNTNDGLYYFITTPFISSLSGYILFCDSIMLCNNYGADGANNFFQKNL